MASALVMSIGHQKFGIPRTYQNQTGIWYFCPKILGTFLVCYQCFENELVKIWLNIGIFRQNKIGLVFGFCSFRFFGIGLVWFVIFRKMTSLFCTVSPDRAPALQLPLNMRLFLVVSLLICLSAEAAVSHRHVGQREREDDGAYSPRDKFHLDGDEHDDQFDHEAILGEERGGAWRYRKGAGLWRGRGLWERCARDDVCVGGGSG